MGGLRAWRSLNPWHRHRAEPELSALVAFPSCRCGALLWPSDQPPAPTRPETAVDRLRTQHR